MWFSLTRTEGKGKVRERKKNASSIRFFIWIKWFLIDIWIKWFLIDRERGKYLNSSSASQSSGLARTLASYSYSHTHNYEQKKNCISKSFLWADSNRAPNHIHFIRIIIQYEQNCSARNFPISNFKPFSPLFNLRIPNQILFTESPARRASAHDCSK